MKILAVRLRNLNSLTGSWTIDFTAPEYGAAGLFAITGPTGAGKTTILDALCLALFARTPRLGHVSKGSNEIMARRTGDCFAEVEFETLQGHYRCHWAQHRARRSPGGDLQPPRHEMVDAASGRVLESRSKEVIRLVEQVTGMDYDRFTRSILLAQGDFAAFLDADADQRAPILEQLTGTAIYSRISVAVHERTSEQRRRTALLEEAVGRITLLSDEEEQALTAAIEEDTITAGALHQRLSRLTESLHRLAAMHSLHADIEATDGLLVELAHRREAAGDDLIRLERGRRAQTLLAEFSRLRHVRQRLADLEAGEASVQSELAGLRLHHQHIATEHGQAVRAAQEAVALRQREAETIALVRGLDLRLHDRKRAIDQRLEARLRTERERTDLLRGHGKLERQLADIAIQQEQVDLFLHDHAADGLLVEHLAGFRERLHQVAAREIDLARLVQTRQDTAAARIEAEREIDRLGREETLAAAAVDGLRHRVQELEQARAEQLEGREPAFFRQRVEEEEERLRSLEQAMDLLRQQRILGEEQTARDEALGQARARQDKETAVLAGLEHREQVQRMLVERCEQARQLALRIRSLEEERAQLRAGTPCPLCGATDHPWAVDLPTVDGEEAGLTRARTDLDKVRAAVVRSRETLAGLAKEIEHLAMARARGERQAADLARRLDLITPLLEGGTEAERMLAEGRDRWQRLRDRVLAVERLDEEERTARGRLELALAQHAERNGQLRAARHAGERLATEWTRLDQQAREAEGRVAQQWAELHLGLQSLGIDACGPGQADALLHHLESRLRAWKERQEHGNRLRSQQALLDKERDRLALRSAATDATLARLEADLAELHREAGDLRDERRRRYEDRDPDVEEQRLNGLVREAEARQSTIGARLTELDKTIHAREEHQRLGGEEMAALRPQCQTLASELLARLVPVGFSDLDDLEGALLPAETLDRLGILEQELVAAQTELAARRSEQTAALARLSGQHDATIDRETMEAELADCQRQLETVQQQVGAARERLAANSREGRRLAEQRHALAAEQQELARWETLHQLIGSADGKKFRVFAQGLTFEVMISHANRQLRAMSDRYLLLRDPGDPLGLQVIDHYQAGEIRSTRNLSGGEGFLVSLALALGLSAMASHHVRVDSLFLDEGFGTLDEETLDTALQTLAELRRQGKLIGIISHVPLLRDRIDVRIRVVPGPGGTSRLRGPGCSHAP